MMTKIKKVNMKKPKEKKYIDIYKSIRKPSIPSTKIINPKKGHNRKDKSWMDQID